MPDARSPGSPLLDTRTRIGLASSRLFAQRGYAGTGLKQVAAEAEAPFGSIYHFFPGGKDELAEAMIRTGAERYMATVLAVLGERDDVVGAVAHAFDIAEQHVVGSGYADACPIATVALDVASTNDRLRQACSDAFAHWTSAGEAFFRGHGLPDEVARDLATSFVMLTEGAFMLARTLRDPQPLRTAGRAMVALTEQALGQARSKSRWA